MSRNSLFRRTLLFALGALVLVPVLRIAAAARIVPAELTFNNGAEVTTLDPATVTGVPEGRVVRALFEGLYVKHPRTLEPLPAVATGYELSEDGRTYTFHLREDARWTNGDPVTAHDFVFSWERLLNPETAAEYAYQLWYVKGAREYSGLSDDRLYAPAGAWVERLGPGRVRVGATSSALVDDVTRVVPGRVVSMNPSADATDESDWIAELDVERESVEALLESGALLDAATYRRDVFWPREVGIRAESARELVVELTDPTPYFLQLTSFYPLFPVNRKNLEDARARWPDSWQLEWVRPENIVTNGPFRMTERRVNDRIRLVKAGTYWDASSVALDSIDVLAVENYSTMLNMYLMGEVAWIDRISTNQVHRLIEREDFQPVPYVGTYFYRVNTTRPPFDDVRVRRALALSIDRRAICEKILKAGQEPSWSLVPPGMAGYAMNELSHAPVGDDLSAYEAAFAKDLERAKELLAEAGFGPGGAELPTFEIHYNTAEAHRDIAEVVAAGWKKHLGLDARLLNQEWKVYLATQRTLGYEVSRSAWIGDYVDPNTFLDLFVTGGENNRTGWGNAEYDDLVRRAAAELDPALRNALLGRAEEILMGELPILPIYFYVTQSMFNPRLGGFHNNILDEHFPKFWYWRSDEELAAKRARQPVGWEVVPAPGPREGKYAANHEPGRWDER